MLELTNGRVSGVSPPKTGFLKVRGFLKKTEGLIKLLLQRSGDMKSPSNELAYLKYMAETNLFIFDEADYQDLR